MGDQKNRQEREGLREAISGLTKGEVVRYRDGYLIVAEIDLTRGIVKGKLEKEIYGVNQIPISELEKTKFQIAKWSTAGQSYPCSEWST